jgi:Fe-S cluster assembly protein SufD
MSHTLTAAGFTQEAFDSFLDSRTEPGWLVDLRRAAWARFNELAMPARNDEEWVRTDIRLFKLDRFGFPTGAPVGSDMPRSLLAEGVALGGSTVTSDSVVVGAQLAEKWAAKGVLFGDLATMVAEHGDLLKPYFERRVVDANRDKFAALNAAAWAGGALLYVPKRVAIDEPLHSLSAMTDGGVD